MSKMLEFQLKIRASHDYNKSEHCLMIKIKIIIQLLQNLTYIFKKFDISQLKENLTLLRHDLSE